MKLRRLLAVFVSLFLLSSCSSIEPAEPVPESTLRSDSQDEILDQFFSDIASLLFGSTEPAPESTLRVYPSSDSVKQFFAENKPAFSDIVQLAQENEEFFFQNDNDLVPSRLYEYAAYFDESERQSIRSFFELSGALSMSYHNIWVEKYGNERCGKEVAFPFAISQPGVYCVVIYLSSSSDQAIKNKMIEQRMRMYSSRYTIEIEELGDGWFLLTRYKLPDD